VAALPVGKQGGTKQGKDPLDAAWEIQARRMGRARSLDSKGSGRSAMATPAAAQTPSDQGKMVAKAGWTTADSAVLYGVDEWGKPYFSVNDQGHIQISPQGAEGPVMDLVDLVKGLQGRNLSLPLLIRFDNILEDRLQHLHQAFQMAIENTATQDTIKVYSPSSATSNAMWSNKSWKAAAPGILAWKLAAKRNY